MRILIPKPKTILQTLRETKESVWSTIYCLLNTLGTFQSFSACEGEQRASCPRQLKSYTHATMDDTRLTALALLHTHYAMPIGQDKVNNL